ncbi:dTMP kinase [Curvibacter sp. APW13]|uniref:dTMP kinase n=1 Tax=Curvibacter sp. APW13 TaxID=3077236 RepID=UPI0028E07583|nr:dTMP kinase [Curvibacter sp. APW13]MDT8991638.1 dTMP kinase [Curvibacter sp. APW13]
MQPGIFITMEGIDGAGKSTHIERLATLFRTQGRTVVVSREPGGTPLAEKIRSVLLAERMDSLSEALLMFASRREHIVDVIAPALRRGEVVISDRYTDSSFAYQGGGRQFDTSKLDTLEAWVQDAGADVQAVVPDLTLWFDLPAEVAAARLSTARAPDKFESESVAFFGRVIAAYARRQQQNPSRIARIDAHQSVEDVWQQVLRTIQQRGWGAP